MPGIRLLLLLVACWFVVAGGMTWPAMAQGTRKALITIEHKPFVRPQYQGLPLAIAARITSPAGVHKAVVYCRAQGGKSFTALSMQPGENDTYQAVIPDWMTAGEVLEYYITAKDRLGQSTSRGFVGFPLTVRLVSGRAPTREERVQSLEQTLRALRQRSAPAQPDASTTYLPQAR